MAPGRIVSGVIVAGIIAIALDRFVLGPMRDDRTRDALPRAPLSQVIDGVETLDLIVFLDHREGWFAITDPEAAADNAIALPGLAPGQPLSGAAHLPVYCGNDTGRILWGTRAARIVKEIAVCDPALMDLSGLRDRAQPVRMERDLLTAAQVKILAQEVAADPFRLPVTLPTEIIDLPLERVVVLPWIWAAIGDNRDPQDAIDMGAQWLAEALAGHAGDAHIETAARSAPGLTVPDGRVAPLLVVDGEPAVVDGLSALLRPVYRVRCEAEACAALDDIAAQGLLDAWRDRQSLDAALAGARRASYSGPAEALPDRAALLEEVAAVSPATEFLHVVRVARRLVDAPDRK